MAGRGHGAFRLRHSPPDLAAEDQSRVAVPPGDEVERLDQRRHAFSRLERAHEHDERRLLGQRQRGQRGAISPLRRLLGREPRVVHPVRRHHDRGPHRHPVVQPLGGDLAHADQHARGPCGPPDGPAEEGRLRPDMPLGVIEEGAVVDRDSAGHRGPCGHRVMRAVVEADPERPQQRREPDLLVDQPARARFGNHRPDGGRLASQVGPPPLIAPPGQQRQRDVRPRGEPPTKRHGVVAGTARSFGHGRYVERERERLAHRSRAPEVEVLLRRGAPRPAPHVLSPPRGQVGAHGVVGQDVAEPGGDVLDVEGVDEPRRRRRRIAEVVHTGDLTPRRTGYPPASPPGGQAVALGERDVGEGPGAPVQLGQDRGGNGAREDRIGGRNGS